MSKNRVILLHVFIWFFAIFANLPFSLIGKNIPLEQQVTNIIAFLYLMVTFYIFYLFIVPHFLEKKKLVHFFIVSFFLILLMPFFGYSLLFLNQAIFRNSFSNFYSGYTLKMHMSGYFPVLTAAVFGSFFKVIISWFSTMNQKAELDRQKMAIELDLLKSKLNPHFLFNTLNNIDSLINTDQNAASAALIRLSDIMRYMTYETRSDKVPLGKEIRYIENLIELNRIRIHYPDKIKFNVSVEESLEIAPALFLPLIENSFKFASFRMGTPAISIKLTNSDKIIQFEVFNYFDPEGRTTGSDNSGTGIPNLIKRLELLYPGHYELQREEKDNVYCVNLKIDTNDNQLYRN